MVSIAQPVYDSLQNEQGLLPVASLPQLLSRLDLAAPDCEQVVASVAGPNVKTLTQEQT